MGIFIGIAFIFLDIFIIVTNILYNWQFASFNMPLHVTANFVNQIFIYWFIVLLANGIFFIFANNPRTPNSKAAVVFIFGFIIIFDTLLKVALLWGFFDNAIFHFNLFITLFLTTLLGLALILHFNFARIIVIFLSVLSLSQLLTFFLKSGLAFSEIINSVHTVLFAFGAIWFLTRKWVKEQFANHGV